MHAHPAFSPERGGVDGGCAGERLRLARASARGLASAASRTAWYCPDWGQALPRSVLVLAGDGLLPVVFGYVLAPAGLAAALQVVRRQAGVTVTGLVDGRAVHVRSERCTSSS